MRLSRFWLIPLGGAFLLSLARCRVDHTSARAAGALAADTDARAARTMADSLDADASAVERYLGDDARERAAALDRFTRDPEVGGGLARATGAAKIARETRRDVKAALRRLAAEVSADLRFDATWAVDAGGRVVAGAGFDHTDEWELGGYPSVAEAINGWIRDDTWAWNGRLYHVVMRPVEREAQGEPVGAVIGGKIIDDAFARSVTRRTGAAVSFYVGGGRVATGAPEGFDAASLEEITRDLQSLEQDDAYREKGRSEVRVVGQHLGVMYARLPGEARELGAGYAVGRLPSP